ncbi:MAG TPA: MFS transporter [Terriglobales bacterium]|nr:MFS transporter [Terriglobales bacterium]
MRWRTLAALTLAELLAISPWFAGTVVLPELSRRWGADLNVAAWLTIAVQLGFVLGALASAALNLSDVFPAPRVMLVSALLVAVANSLFAELAAEHLRLALAARFLTGFFLAGGYPTAMKIMAGWFREGRGTALGILIGGLTVGSASPYLIKALPFAAALDLKVVVNTASASTLAGALLVALFVREGPFLAATPRFDIRQVGETFRNRRLLLANLGYWGHMWEVYTMWGWIGVLMMRSHSDPGSGQPSFLRTTQLWAFAAIAAGALGCYVAGRIADRAAASQLRQRANVTMVAMAVSGACCLVAAAVIERWEWFIPVALVWGVSVVADSAQFSAVVSEVSDPRYVGTALTMQVALGFTLTAVSLQFFGWMMDRHHMHAAIALLALGPALGILAMWRLKATARATA